MFAVTLETFTNVYTNTIRMLHLRKYKMNAFHNNVIIHHKRPTEELTLSIGKEFEHMYSRKDKYGNPKLFTMEFNRDHGRPRTRNLLLIFAFTKIATTVNADTTVMATISDIIKDNNSSSVIIIYPFGITDKPLKKFTAVEKRKNVDGRTILAGIRIELFEWSTLQNLAIDWVYTPSKYVLCGKDERNAIRIEVGDLTRLAQAYENDAVMKLYGALGGDLFRIELQSPIDHDIKLTDYRLIVPIEIKSKS